MRIQPINSVEDFDVAVQIAEDDASVRWYVARVAQANGWSDRIPPSWNESQTKITSFREYPENEQEAVSEHLSAVVAEVEDYGKNFSTLDDVMDAALAASIASDTYREQFETGLVASLDVYVNYEQLTREDAEAIVAAAKKPRRVRTPAGVRRFKQPIDTIIMSNGRAIKPGDAGYSEANKAAGGTGNAPKARIAPKTATTKADKPALKKSDRDALIEKRYSDVSDEGLVEGLKQAEAREEQAEARGADPQMMRDLRSRAAMIRSQIYTREAAKKARAEREKAAPATKSDSIAPPPASKKISDMSRQDIDERLEEINSALEINRRRNESGAPGRLTTKQYDELAAERKDLQAARDKAPTAAKPKSTDAAPKTAIGGPNDKAAAKLVRAKMSEIAKAKTRDELRDIDLDELKEFVDNNDVHDDVKKMVEAVSDFRSNKSSWNDYRQRAANAFRPDDVSSARNSARNYSARAKNDRDKIKDTLDAIAGKAPAAKLEWVQGKSFGSATVTAEPNFKGDVFRSRSTGKYYANLLQDSQTILDKEFTSEVAARRAIEDKIKQTKKGMDAGKSPKVIDPEVVKAGKDAAKAEKAADEKSTSPADLSKMSDDDLKSYADTMKRNLDSAASGGPTGKRNSAQIEALIKRDLAAREELARRESATKKADRRTSSDVTPAERKRRATILVEELESEYGAADLSEFTDSELTEADNLRTSAQNLRLIANEAAAPLEQKHREQLRNISRRIDEEMTRRARSGAGESSAASDTNTADRRADLAARASALGDKKMTPGRLNQRIRTVEKHLKGVEERIQARKARGLNPTKVQLRNRDDLKNQLKALNARKNGGGSDTSASSASSTAASSSTASPDRAPSAPATAKQSLNSSAQTELADFADKMGRRLDSVNVKSLDKFINADDNQIDPDLKSAARRLKVAHDNLKKSKRKNRNRMDKMTDVRNYSEARDHARKLLEKSKNKSDTEKSLSNDSTDKASKPAAKSRIAPATSDYKTTDTVPHSVTRKVQQQFADSRNRPDAKDIMDLNDSQLSEMMSMGFEEDYYSEGVYKIFGTAESWAEYYARQQGITLSPEQRKRVGEMVLGSKFRSTENMSHKEYGDYMIDANDGIEEANKKLDAKLRKAGDGEGGGSGKGLSPRAKTGGNKTTTSKPSTKKAPAERSTKTRQENLFKALDDLTSAIAKGDLSADDAKKITDLAGKDPFSVESEEDRLTKLIHNAVKRELQRQRSQSVEARYGRFRPNKFVSRADRVPSASREKDRDNSINAARNIVTKLREASGVPDSAQKNSRPPRRIHSDNKIKQTTSLFRAELRRQDALEADDSANGTPSSDALAIAEVSTKPFVDAEPSVTEAVGVELMLNSGAPYKLQFRRKSTTSFARKIDSKTQKAMLHDPSLSREDTLRDEAGKIKDVIRYTGMFSNETYWEDSDSVLEGLEAKGHKILKDKGAGRTWPIAGYRGRNVQMQNEHGVPYELQFHTKETVKAVELNHALYEKQRLLKESDPEWMRLQEEMDANFAKTQVPPGTNWGEAKRG